MEDLTFDKWLSGLDLSFWGTAQHKVTPAQFFERQQTEGAVLLDVRSAQEVDQLALPFALHIPVDELPSRWQEVPADWLVAAFCSSVSRAVTAWVYLQLHGLANVRILDGGYNELSAQLLPGKVYRRMKSQ
jgi:rhodanese-related sulfurtransferase